MKEDSNSPVAANGNNDTPTPTKKARAGKGTPSKRSGALGPIPTSYEEAGEEDRLLIKMKEVEGKPWTAIQNALEEMTGSKIGAGLSMRYSRMKANFVVFAKEDVGASLLLLFRYSGFILTIYQGRPPSPS